MLCCVSLLYIFIIYYIYILINDQIYEVYVGSWFNVNGFTTIVQTKFCRVSQKCLPISIQRNKYINICTYLMRKEHMYIMYIYIVK